MLYTNTPLDGHETIATLFSELQERLHSGGRLSIAVGYVSVSELLALQEIEASPPGAVRILDGMARTRSLAPAYFDIANELATHFQAFELRVPRQDMKPYHGKLFVVEDVGASEVFVGSANFSRNAVEQQYELVVRPSEQDRVEAIRLRDWLFSDEYSMSLGSSDLSPQPAVPAIRADQITLPRFIISLRFDEKGKSGVNTFFGKPRSGEKYRDWFEIELSLNQHERRQPLVPALGEDFYVKDPRSGEMVLCKRSGDNGKEIRSVGNLRLLGAVVKGVLGLRREDFYVGDVPKRPIKQQDLGNTTALAFVRTGEVGGRTVFEMVPCSL